MRWPILLSLQKFFGEPHESANFAYGAALLLKFGSGRKLLLCIVQMLPELGKGQRHFDILSQLVGQVLISSLLNK